MAYNGEKINQDKCLDNIKNQEEDYTLYFGEIVAEYYK